MIEQRCVKHFNIATVSSFFVDVFDKYGTIFTKGNLL